VIGPLQQDIVLHSNGAIVRRTHDWHLKGKRFVYGVVRSEIIVRLVYAEPGLAQQIFDFVRAAEGFQPR
jgi:hypothetical protein